MQLISDKELSVKTISPHPLFSLAPFLLFTFILAACTAAPPPTLPPVPPNAPSPLFTSSPFPTRSPAPSDIPAPELTVTLAHPTEKPSQTPIPRYTIEPLVTPLSPESSPFFDSWSLDSVWIAFWLVDYGNDTLPGSLAFVRVDSGEICLHPEVVTEGVGYEQVHWQEDGHAQVVPYPPDQIYTGVPCETFVSSAPLPGYVGEISPNGRYRVDETYEPFEEGPNAHVVTTLSDLSTNQIITSVSWDFVPYDALGGGPRWLNNEIYLIGPAYDQGFLYFSLPDGAIHNVTTDLLGLDASYVANYRTIYSKLDSINGGYHLLLKSEVGPTPAPLLLYHSETEEIEPLPFNYASSFSSRGPSNWPPGFSPDGQWLLLGGAEGREFWLRPVDPPGSEAFQFAGVGSPGGLSLEQQKMAFFREDIGLVNILSFPEGIILSRLNAPGYDFLEPVAWSPDGNRLAIVGHRFATNQTSLFVIEP